jgi:hypothetical protein
MKSDVKPRPAPESDQLAFDSSEFTPYDFSRGVLSLLEEDLDLDVEFSTADQWKADSDTAKPVIICEVGGLAVDRSRMGRVETGFGLNSHSGSVDNSITYAAMLSGSLAIRCVARSYKEISALGYTVFKTTLGFCPFMPEMFDVHRFSVGDISPPQRVEKGSDHKWVVEIKCTFEHELAWSVSRVAPRLKSLGLGLH